MRLAGVYTFNSGREIIEAQFIHEFREVKDIIDTLDSTACIDSNQPQRRDNLYNPQALSKALKIAFKAYGWSGQRVACEYPVQYYVGGYHPNSPLLGAYREMDCIKNRIGVGIQFVEYASSMVYNVCAKMTIFHKLGVIDVGIEIVPVKEFANEMSTGVSYFEQFVWDLEQRGISNIDIPVLILGITHK